METKTLRVPAAFHRDVTSLAQTAGVSTATVLSELTRRVPADAEPSVGESDGGGGSEAATVRSPAAGPQELQEVMRDLGGLIGRLDVSVTRLQEAGELYLDCVDTATRQRDELDFRTVLARMAESGGRTAQIAESLKTLMSRTEGQEGRR